MAFRRTRHANEFLVVHPFPAKRNAVTELSLGPILVRCDRRHFLSRYKQKPSSEILARHQSRTATLLMQNEGKNGEGRTDFVKVIKEFAMLNRVIRLAINIVSDVRSSVLRYLQIRRLLRLRWILEPPMSGSRKAVRHAGRTITDAKDCGILDIRALSWARTAARLWSQSSPTISTIFQVDFNERRWPPLNYETSDEEELSATFDSLGQDELDVHQFEAMAGASATDESCRYSTQSFQDYYFRAAAAVVPAPCSRQRPTIVRSNTPPPLGKTITPLRVTVGVVIGVADLILPDKNIGELPDARPANTSLHQPRSHDTTRLCRHDRTDPLSAAARLLILPALHSLQILKRNVFTHTRTRCSVSFLLAAKEDRSKAIKQMNGASNRHLKRTLQVMINRWNDLVRFALMHSMATSLFFWFWSVRKETVNSLHHRRLLKDHQQKPESDTAITTMSYLMNLTGEVGIWFIMWQNVGKVDDTYRSGDGSRSTSASRNNHYDHQLLLRNHLVIHADCSSANRGLFAGLVVMVATAVSIIVFFLAFSDRRYVTTGIWIGLVSESTLLILMICAAGLACRQLAVLDINANPVSQLDDLLLFICIPSFFLYGIFSIVPAIAYSNYMALFVAILQPQCRNGEQASRPGREVITFPIVCNLSMWFMETLEIKSYETNMDRIHFYGEWLVIGAKSTHSSLRNIDTIFTTRDQGTHFGRCSRHVTLPLTLFYRFHSASCLVDIWKSAYEAPEQ
ncbi:hypothetical protein DAPPUDRAFT_110386 [Daphnia pulex]|uniref:Uncharacterized protein n=1 Tax=Daphnia pulex TaxID=6669 RepID=E9H658_DAPPU|nr:hypothetical protein DAPPUDRAFT_110386 [Daphnia pulex]|eukprot:EFX72750.1 hypothetical protein DAPPUDRAFT_110386 [Daphnia pulex]